MYMPGTVTLKWILAAMPPGNVLASLFLSDRHIARAVASQRLAPSGIATGFLLAQHLRLF